MVILIQGSGPLGCSELQSRVGSGNRSGDSYRDMALWDAQNSSLVLVREIELVILHESYIDSHVYMYLYIELHEVLMFCVILMQENIY